jgi:hypothetical protein
MAAKKSSARYYAKNKAARLKKNAYQRKYNKKPEIAKDSDERWTERRQIGRAHV